MAGLAAPRRGGSSRSIGVSNLYLVLVMTVLCGFVSLAVDLGRVQMAKTELQQAADAAALAGVSGLEAGVTEAQDRAIAERSGLPPLGIKSIKRSKK